MESLRWVLLAAGIAFVVVIYFLGRSRRKRNHSIVDELEDDLPEFSAGNLDDVDEGVGEVRVVTHSRSELEDEEVSLDENGDELVESQSTETVPAEKSFEAKMPSDFIVLYVLPKVDPTTENPLLGAQINSAAQAMGLTFGEMNIFHYKPNTRNVFSLANMLEPGSFDPDTIHDLKTTGLTVFMKISGQDPLDDLTEMLQRSYQMAGLLDARLCSHKRETLTEQDAENYRAQVKDFTEGNISELSTES